MMCRYYRGCIDAGTRCKEQSALKLSPTLLVYISPISTAPSLKYPQPGSILHLNINFFEVALYIFLYAGYGSLNRDAY